MEAAPRRPGVSTAKRLAKDFKNLFSEDLPLYYLWPVGGPDASSLSSLDILITGPEGTPYLASLFKLHLEIPTSYPVAPPKAFFRTKIFHPNVDPASGAVCLETLKRDWRSELTLRDVLATIACLLIQPNPDSALNEEAGKMIQTDFAAFENHARLMGSIHARVPADLRAAVDEAVRRGDGPTDEQDTGSENQENDENAENHAADDIEMHEDKENDASLSPTPVLQRPALPVRTGVKRPLGEMMIPMEEDKENDNEKNIAANAKNSDLTNDRLAVKADAKPLQRLGLSEVTRQVRMGAPPAKRIATARARIGIRRL